MVRGFLRSEGLVVAVRVEGELAQEFAGAGVDDADVEVVDEHEDSSAFVGGAEWDVPQASGVAEGDGAGLVGDVAAHSPVGIEVAGAGFGFRQRSG